MAQSCPSCAKPAEGRFCSHCGASLEAVPCVACGSELPAGGRYCNQCGALAAAPSAPQEAAPAGTPSRLPWVVAGVALVALAVTAVAPRFLAEPAPAAPPAAAPAAGGTMPSGAELAAMDPREAADRLFNRVMQAVSTGDSAQAEMFLPMALAAYDRVPELDLDGRYHVAVLQLVEQDYPAARAQAEEILGAEPNHLFGLFVAAEAERAQGDTEAARELYQRFLDSYDSEIARQLREYQDHARVLPVNKEAAEKYLGSS